MSILLLLTDSVFFQVDSSVEMQMMNSILILLLLFALVYSSVRVLYVKSVFMKKILNRCFPSLRAKEESRFTFSRTSNSLNHPSQKSRTAVGTRNQNQAKNKEFDEISFAQSNLKPLKKKNVLVFEFYVEIEFRI